MSAVEEKEQNGEKGLLNSGQRRDISSIGKSNCNLIRLFYAIPHLSKMRGISPGPPELTLHITSVSMAVLLE